MFPPPCIKLGAQCRSLRVTLRIGSLDEGATSLDHEATWLLGHTQQITFAELWEDEGDLYVEAVLHVPCRYLRQEGAEAHCRAHGFEGPAPRASRRAAQPRQLGGSRFAVVDGMRLVARSLPPPKRSLPILPSPRQAQRGIGDGNPMKGEAPEGNPCESAPCQTADHRRGAACCRDLQVEIMCTRDELMLETLVRSRRSPYLCKVTRPGDFSIEAELISACGYLEPGGVGCTLHGKTRADGRAAKPDLCSDWPPKNQGLHPGCVFARTRRRRVCKTRLTHSSP